jgi:hypothetical protein
MKLLYLLLKGYMEKYYFNSLSMISKIEVVWNFGEQVAEKEYEYGYATLFLLDKFYVEVFMDKLNNSVRRILVQERPGALYKYVKAIDLNGLLCNY